MRVISDVRWRHRRRQLWVVPSLFVTGAALSATLLPWMDRRFPWIVDDVLGRNVDLKVDFAVVSNLLSAIASGMIAFTGFVFTVVLLSVQFGTSNFSARLIPMFQRDPVVRVAMGLFMATFIYTLLLALRLGTRLESFEPFFSTSFAVFLTLASVLAFFALVSRIVDLLRVVRLLRRVSHLGHRTIAEAYPRAFAEQPAPEVPAPIGPGHAVLHSEPSAVLLGTDVEELAAMAAKHDLRIDVVPEVGDFVLYGTPLCVVHGESRPPEWKLRQHFAFGEERDLADDPAFVFRVLADVALKAQSPTVSDPTTAVQTLDHIEDLLLNLVARDLGDGVAVVGGTIRVTFPTPLWEDYVTLATDEVRQHGSDSIQVLRRLRALLRRVLAASPPSRRPPLEERLFLLDEVAKRYDNPVDYRLATHADSQGLGGAGDR